MKEFFKLLSSPLAELSDDAISSCARNLKTLKEMKASYPPLESNVVEHCINLKA